jgi:hypothetical protein
MKKRISALALSMVLILATTTSSRATDDFSAEAMIADTIVVRPICFAATAVGTAFFIVSLPFSLISRSTPKAARALVAKPAAATFTRPLGDMSALL